MRTCTYHLQSLWCPELLVAHLAARSSVSSLRKISKHSGRYHIGVGHAGPVDLATQACHPDDKSAGAQKRRVRWLANMLQRSIRRQQGREELVLKRPDVAQPLDLCSDMAKAHAVAPNCDAAFAQEEVRRGASCEQWQIFREHLNVKRLLHSSCIAAKPCLIASESVPKRSRGHVRILHGVSSKVSRTARCT